MSGIPSKNVYLQPEFDSNSLKVAQLRGILLEHSVHAPSTAKKADLVELFEEHVKSRAGDLLSEAADVQPSDDGIVHVDGHGQEIAKTPRKRARASVAAEALAVHDAANDAAAAIAATPSAATKKTPGRRRTLAPPATITKDDDESATADLGAPVTPVAAATNRRRRTMGGPTPAKGASDGEDDIPATTARRTTARKSLAPTAAPRSALKKQPSVAALREQEEEGGQGLEGTAPSSEAEKGRGKVSKVDDARSAPEVGRAQPKFKSTRRLSDEDEGGFSDYNPFQSGGGADSPMPMPLKERKKRKTPSSPEVDRHPASPPPMSPPSLRRFQPDLPSLSPSSSSPVRVQKKNKDNAVAIPEKVDTTKALSRPSSTRRVTTSAIPLTGLALAVVAWVYNYKQASTELGFCDTGSNVNAIMLDKRYRIAQAEACVLERSKEMDEATRLGQDFKMEACPHEEDLPLISFIPSPDSCAVCPPHAQCDEGQFVKCDLDYVEKLHPLAWLAPVVDGLPGLGPVAFAPKCEKDYKRKKQVLEIARALERKLALHRGEVLCGGRRVPKGQPEVVAFGYQERQLLDEFLARTTLPRETFVLNFEEALADLLDHGDATKVVNETTGNSYIAGTRAEMPLTCRLRLAATTKAHENRQYIALGASGLALVAYLRSMIRSKRAETKQIKDLVQVALDRLQDQQTHILPDQLRDFVLAEMHVPARRQEIWKRVRPIIESNANVRVSEVELHGDTWPAWEWVGVSKIEQESSKRQALPAYPVA